ncbi:MAG: D-glycerate dehydrogenase [Acidimicrobiia bacterium]|nr:D-glycerate dehydrogenase [Acidimicrobiia bacterium]
MKIVVTRAIDEARLSPLEGHHLVVWPHQTQMPHDELVAELSGATGVVSHLTDRLDRETIVSAGDLRAVSQVAVGVDNIDLGVCTERRIPVGHTPDVLTETTADTAWALLASAVRRIPEGREHVLAGEWGPWRPDLLLGGDLHDTTLGVVGLGRIGAAVARRAAGFAMKVLYAGPRRKPHLEAELRASYRPLENLVREADHIVVTVPLSESTRGLIGTPELEAMKPDATLVNVSRGPVVDTTALTEALDRGLLAGVALDVTDPEPLPADHPLLGHPNCLVIPHLGSASRRTRAAMVDLAISNMAEALGGRRMPACANPEVYG